MWRRPWAEINPIPEISLEGNALSFPRVVHQPRFKRQRRSVALQSKKSPHLTPRSSRKHLLCRRLVACCKGCDIAREDDFAAAIATLRAKFDDPVRQANDIEIMLDD